MLMVLRALAKITSLDFPAPVTDVSKQMLSVGR